MPKLINVNNKFKQYQTVYDLRAQNLKFVAPIPEQWPTLAFPQGLRVSILKVFITKIDHGDLGIPTVPQALVMKTFNMDLLTPLGNALLGSHFVRACVLRSSNFGPSGRRLKVMDNNNNNRNSGTSPYYCKVVDNTNRIVEPVMDNMKPVLTCLSLFLALAGHA